MEMRTRKIFIFGISLLAFIIVSILNGCMGGAETQIYRNPSFKAYKITTIAILPIKNSKLSDAESLEVNRYFISGISPKLSGHMIISPETAIQKLDKDSISYKYYKYLDANSASEKINAEMIKQIGSTLHCDAILQCEIYNISVKGGVYGRRFANTSCNLRYSLISTKDGSILWRAQSKAYERTSETDEPAPPLYEAIENGMDDIIYEMGKLE
jgi:PBP1b-binding outer membrane lipoprotein LpoB